ncbi:F0F1 ATP synthase subunit delta [soil metagenome]
MRGISAKSLTSVLEAVSSSAGKTAGKLGDELFGVVGALDGAPALRRVLTDPSTDDSAKEGLAVKVFGGKVSAATIKVVVAAVTGRWASGRDMVDGLELAGVSAHVIQADKAGELDELENELFTFERLVSSEPELRRILTDRSIPEASKSTLVSTLLAGKATPAVLALVQQATAARLGSFEKAISSFSEIVAERRARLIAEVRVAYELGDDERARLNAALKAKYGSDIQINTIVDPSVVGGISVSIGDQLIDGTVSSRLEDARRRIAG